MSDKLMYIILDMVILFTSLSVFFTISILTKKLFYKKHLFFEKINFLSIFFVGLILFLSIYILYKHQVRDCIELDKDAICQCFALEISETTNVTQKIKISNTAIKYCKKSMYIKKHLVNLK